MNRIVRSAAFGLVLAALPWLPLASAQVYKWVDERGVTHYGEKPPANKGRPVELKDATGGATKPAMPPERVGKKLEAEEREFQRRQVKRNQEAEAARKAQERERRDAAAAKRAQLADCRRATRDLAVIRSNPSAHSFAEESRVRDSISRNCP